MFHVPEQFRITSKKNPYASSKEDGNNGAFAIKRPKKNLYVRRDKYGHIKQKQSNDSATLFVCIASDGMDWEHVSVSLPMEQRCPSWEEMCDIKAMFWDPTDTVIQYHPDEKEYVNNHPRVLHLWRPLSQHVPVPPKEMVGIKGLGQLIK